MTIRVGRLRAVGGLFLVDTTALRIVSILEEPTVQSLWNIVREGWMRQLSRSDVQRLINEAEGHDGAYFEFKGKYFVNLGLSESGFRRIRWVEKLHSPLHDDALNEFHGEEDEPSAVSA